MQLLTHLTRIPESVHRWKASDAFPLPCGACVHSVVKSRMQGLDAAQYKNSTDCAMQIMKQEGIGESAVAQMPRLASFAPCSWSWSDASSQPLQLDLAI